MPDLSSHRNNEFLPSDVVKLIDSSVLYDRRTTYITRLETALGYVLATLTLTMTFVV
jgi:hypothetical protein